jgi:hypothetical protein
MSPISSLTPAARGITPDTPVLDAANYKRRLEQKVVFASTEQNEKAPIQSTRTASAPARVPPV